MRHRVALAVAVCLLAGVCLATSTAAARTHSAVIRHAVTRHCGSFKYGSDGSRPGPSEITAKRVSCRFARAVALRGGAAGWHCHIAMGLEFVCRPARGRGVVTFLGE